MKVLARLPAGGVKGARGRDMEIGWRVGALGWKPDLEVLQR